MVIELNFPYSFRYQWPATVAGSYCYSSFTELQRTDGFVGRYIVRQTPEEEPHSKLYDYDLTEHYMLIQESYHRVSISIILLQLYTNLTYFKLLSVDNCTSRFMQSYLHYSLNVKNSESACGIQEFCLRIIC